MKNKVLKIIELTTLFVVMFSGAMFYIAGGKTDSIFFIICFYALIIHCIVSCLK